MPYLEHRDRFTVPAGKPRPDPPGRGFVRLEVTVTDDMPATLADCDAYIAEARQAELNAWKGDHSGQARKYADLYDTLLELRPMVAMQERISTGVAPQLA